MLISFSAMQLSCFLPEMYQAATECPFALEMRTCIFGIYS